VNAFEDWEKAEAQRAPKPPAELRRERHLKRQAELPAAKAVVLDHLERVGLGARLTDLERALLNVAIKAVRDAR
jgi:hypothetical protein